jgi:hypothetical protein
VETIQTNVFKPLDRLVEFEKQRKSMCMIYKRLDEQGSSTFEEMER